MLETNGHQSETKTEKKHCPLLDEPCIQDECALWTALNITEATPLAPAKMVKRFMCSFQAQLIMASAAKPQQQVTQRVNLPGLRKN